MNLPKHINITIEHNPHATIYESAEEYIKEKLASESWEEHDFISEADKHECIRTNEIWTIQWYPNTPVGFNYVVASTLEKALAKANE